MELLLDITYDTARYLEGTTMYLPSPDQRLRAFLLALAASYAGLYVYLVKRAFSEEHEYDGTHERSLELLGFIGGKGEIDPLITGLLYDHFCGTTRWLAGQCHMAHWRLCEIAHGIAYIHGERYDSQIAWYLQRLGLTIDSSTTFAVIRGLL